jgi:hypothetical protein
MTENVKHADDEPVMVGYSSGRNISFRNNYKEGDELGVTWGEWREMSRAEQNEIINEYLNNLVDVWVIDDED